MNSVIILIVCSVAIFSVIPHAEAKTWKVYVQEMPKQWESHFGNIYDEATTYWEKRIPGTYFVKVNQREKADFVVQWSSQFQGTKLGYYTPSSNNDFGRPYIAITLGYMDDESVKFQDRKFHLVDAEYAKLITTHELGHAIGLKHSEDKNDIMYPTISDYDSWLSAKKFTDTQNQIVMPHNTKQNQIVTQYNTKSIEIQQEANSKIQEVKGYVYSKQELLHSKQYRNPKAQEKINTALQSLEEAKNYLRQAEWTQKEGENYLKFSDYKGSYYKYLYSVNVAKKVYDPIIQINMAVESAEKLESQYQENKESEPLEQKEVKNQTCFLFWCW